MTVESYLAKEVANMTVTIVRNCFDSAEDVVLPLVHGLYTGT
jgi:hypothetical protein